MAIQIITDNHKSTIKKMFESATNTISIASPFIGMNMANLLCAAKDNNPNLTATLITRFCREDFVSRVSSIKALEKLQSKGVKIFAYQILHSKAYLVDDNKALTGSANFTNGGFGKNEELSLYIENEIKINSGLKKYFDDLLTGLDDYLITAEQIEAELRKSKELERRARVKKLKLTIIVLAQTKSQKVNHPHRKQRLDGMKIFG